MILIEPECSTPKIPSVTNYLLLSFLFAYTFQTMLPAQKQSPILNHLDEIERRCAKGDPSLHDIFILFGPDGHFVLIFFLVLPFLQPIPFPGLSTLFGILIAIVACLRYINLPPWLPQRWATKRLPAQMVFKIAEGSEKIFRRITFIHPRISFLMKEPFHSLNIILLVVNAVLLSLPLPIPFSNAIPAWTIALQTMAYLEGDGVLGILSYLGSITCLGFFGIILVKTFSLF